MRVLVVAVAKGKTECGVAPFISDQVELLRKRGCVVDYFYVSGKGVVGYLRHLPSLVKKIREFTPDVIHAHYGLCGLLANLQRRVPVVTTYHGSDINFSRALRLSRLSIRMSAWNIFVSGKLAERSGAERRFSVIPCGVDFNVFKPLCKEECRRKLGLDTDGKIILFAGAFANGVKNWPLAKAAVESLADMGTKADLIEFSGYSRADSALLINASDALLMTSHSEGSPQVIKEAMACCRPIVSVDVGTVREIVSDCDGCHVVDRTPQALATALMEALHSDITDGRRVVGPFDNDSLVPEIMEIYKKSIS